MAGIGAPKGNQYAKGNVGGGRKSAYVEFKTAEKLNEAFTKGYTLNEYIEIAQKVDNIYKRKGGKAKLSLFELTIWRALYSDSVLCNLLKKIFPDKTVNKTRKMGLLDLFKTISEEKNTP